MEVLAVATSRLDLVSMSPDWIEAALAGQPPLTFGVPAGWPEEHDAQFLRLRLEQLKSDPDAQLWLARAMVHRDTSTMIGHIGFHGPPTDGWVELGYTVFEEHRRRGYAEESIQAMMRWAQAYHQVGRFRLSIAPDNQPSLALAAKLGFQKIGEQVDEIDGIEYVFELAAS